MTIKTKFNLQDRVNIIELKTKGVIISISVTETGTQYNVRYFKENAPTTTYFYEFELDPYQEVKKGIGFAPVTPA